MKLSTSGEVSRRVGENVRLLRQSAEMTLAQLAETTAGGDREPIKPSQLQRMETGARGITVDELETLAAALSVSAERLLVEPNKPDLHGIAARINTIRFYRAERQKAIEAARTAATEADAAVEQFDRVAQQMRESIEADLRVNPELAPHVEAWLDSLDEEPSS